MPSSAFSCRSRLHVIVSIFRGRAAGGRGGRAAVGRAVGGRSADCRAAVGRVVGGRCLNCHGWSVVAVGQVLVGGRCGVVCVPKVGGGVGFAGSWWGVAGRFGGLQLAAGAGRWWGAGGASVIFWGGFENGGTFGVGGGL